MGKRKQQCKYFIAMDKQTWAIIISAITLLITLLTAVYNCGRHHMASQKDREIKHLEMVFTSKLHELNRQHREELNDKDKIIDEKTKEMHGWKDKYFLSLKEQVDPSNNSP